MRKCEYVDQRAIPFFPPRDNRTREGDICSAEVFPHQGECLLSPGETNFKTAHHLCTGTEWASSDFGDPRSGADHAAVGLLSMAVGQAGEDTLHRQWHLPLLLRLLGAVRSDVLRVVPHSRRGPGT